jgi:hypothetical protein
VRSGCERRRIDRTDFAFAHLDVTHLRRVRAASSGVRTGLVPAACTGCTLRSRTVGCVSRGTMLTSVRGTLTGGTTKSVLASATSVACTGDGGGAAGARRRSAGGWRWVPLLVRAQAPMRRPDAAQARCGARVLARCNLTRRCSRSRFGAGLIAAAFLGGAADELHLHALALGALVRRRCGSPPPTAAA